MMTNKASKTIPEGFIVDFIGIGAGKSGTTWVSGMLDAHPEICLSEPKEVQFFNKHGTYFEQKNNPYFDESLQWYQKHFLHCGKNKLKGEFSPKYLYDLYAAEKIKNTFPDVKLIVCLRNPVDRAYSQYNFVKNYLGKEKRNFEEAIQKEPEYIEKGLYYKHLKRYLQYFARGQIHILWFEDIKYRPQHVIKELYRFLEVDENFMPSGSSQKANVAKQARLKNISYVIEKYIRILINYRLSILIKILKKLGVHSVVKKITAKDIVYLPMLMETRKYLQLQFVEDTSNLEKLFNKDLSHWK